MTVDGDVIVTVKDPGNEFVAVGRGKVVREAREQAWKNAKSEEAKLCLQSAVLPDP